jgi:hypothetical protein
VIQLGDLLVGDYIMDEEGDVYVVAVKRHGKNPWSPAVAHYTFELTCLTASDENMEWYMAASDVKLHSCWVWHDRFGALV